MGSHREIAVVAVADAVVVVVAVGIAGSMGYSSCSVWEVRSGVNEAE